VGPFSHRTEPWGYCQFAPFANSMCVILYLCIIQIPRNHPNGRLKRSSWNQWFWWELSDSPELYSSLLLRGQYSLQTSSILGQWTHVYWKLKSQGICKIVMKLRYFKHTVAITVTKIPIFSRSWSRICYNAQLYLYRFKRIVGLNRWHQFERIKRIIIRFCYQKSTSISKYGM
jgi:hypothetical protein